MNYSPIIKSYTSWLNENLLITEAGEVDIDQLYRDGNSSAIIDSTVASASAQVKAHPAYTETLNWWRRGGGDINLFQSIFKKPSARKSDRANSLKSAYYWAGSGSNVNMGAQLATFYKVADSIITNGAKLGLDATKIAGLSSAVTGLKQDQAAGFLPKYPQLLGAFIPLPLVKGTVNASDAGQVDVAASLASATPNAFILKLLKSWQVGANKDPELAKDPATSYKTLKSYQADPAKLNSTWQGSLNLTDPQRLEILQAISDKTANYIKKNPTIEFAKAISIATDLYIVPKAQDFNIQQQAAPPAAAPKVITASYPGIPKAANDPNVQSGLSFFQDNEITVTPAALAGINELIKTALATIKQAGGTITAVKTYGKSSTSQVGTTYTSASGTGNPALATDRLASINTALANALTANGVTVAPTINTAKNEAKPNQGPAWTEKEKTDPKFGKPGARTPEYNETYGPYRFAMAWFELTYTVQPTDPTQPDVTATASGTWKVYMKWDNENIEIKWPPIQIGGWHFDLPKAGSIVVDACPIF